MYINRATNSVSDHNKSDDEKSVGLSKISSFKSSKFESDSESISEYIIKTSPPVENNSKIIDFEI